MSKSIDDYRNIIKILKLQLLKVREDNSTLSHALGIASSEQHSSFTPKIEKYGRSKESFAKNILAFLNFGHKSELIGLAPEMVFRIADKKRDKKVNASSFSQILKRLKLRMSELEINQLVNLISRGINNIVYQDYLQCLSAFQINSEKYPFKSSRTYVQLCLIKFVSEAKSYNNAEKLYKQINEKKDNQYISFESFTTFVKRNLTNIQEFELIAVFVGLDVNSECKIERSIFLREISKAFSAIERGVNIEEEFSLIKEQSNIKDKDNKEEKPNISKVKKPNKDNQTKNHQKKQDQEAIEDRHEKDQFKMQIQTGEEAAGKVVKKKPVPAKDNKTQVKLSKGNSAAIVGEFKKMGIKVNDFMQTLLNGEKKTSLVKSFTIIDFKTAFKSIQQNAPNKKIFQLFKSLDTQSNGTIDTTQLLKLWLRGKQMTDKEDVLYRLLYRHFRQIQFEQPLSRFKVLGISENDKLTQDIFSKVFSELDLDKEQNNFIMSTYFANQIKVKDLSELLKAQGKSSTNKKFVKLDKKIYQDFKKVLQKINQKKVSKQFSKLMRLEDGGKSTNQFWETIFTDEWVCWEYCLDIASKLQTFWRDHEFGPTKSDLSGIRSIIGNESNPPPGLPQEQEICWITLEQLIAIHKLKQKVTSWDQQVPLPNDIVQGSIGDCWYVSALSIIANNPENIVGKPIDQCRKRQQLSIFGVNPFLFKFFSKYGIYVFKYYKKFKPIYVLIDDLLPANKATNELLFAKSPKMGTQWVAYLQKSYAKLHHSYSNMISGDIAQGLNDLTCSLPIKETIEASRDDLMDKMKLLYEQQQLMGCSITLPKGVRNEAPVTIDDEKCGLFYGHAYSILEYIDLTTKNDTFNLMKVRNPHGQGEWILDWSDHPKDNNQQYKNLYKFEPDLKKYYQIKIKEAQKAKRPKPIPYKIGADDGEFMMKFTDFKNVFSNLFTGYKLSSQYKCSTIKQSWDSKFPSGICSIQKSTPKERKEFVQNNHQYILTVEQDDTDVLMYIIQEDGRLYRGQKYPYKELCNGTMILLFKLTERQKMLEAFDMEKSIIKNYRFELRRQVNLWQKLKAGTYAIIPCKMKNDIPESEFEFRIYHDKKVSIKKVNGHNNKFQESAEIQAQAIDNSNYSLFLQLLEKNHK